MTDLPLILDPDYVRSIARHEAAHWIIGRRLGASVGAITMNLVHEPGTSSVRVDCHAAMDRIASTKTVPEIEEYLRRRVRVLMVGAIAQLPIDTSATIPATMEIWKNEGADDYAKIREFCQLLRNIQYGDADRDAALVQLNEISSPLFQASVDDVLQVRAPIAKLAERIAHSVKQLNKPYVFSFDEILSIISVEGSSPSV